MSGRGLLSSSLYAIGLLIVQKLESLWKIVDDVTCCQTFLAESLHGDVASQSVEIHTHDAGIVLVVAPCEKSCDDSCQYVTAAGSSHAAVACRVEDDLTVRKAKRTVVTF